jgi:hypothetical protein
MEGYRGGSEQDWEGILSENANLGQWCFFDSPGKIRGGFGVILAWFLHWMIIFAMGLSRCFV